MIVTNKKDQSISVFDARTLAEVARIPTTKKIVHGIAYSPDSKLAFITQESIGADPGAVDMIDLTTLKNVGDPAGAGAADRHLDLAEAMTFEALTTLDGPTVLARAKEFFAERVPLNAAFPETRGRRVAGAPRPGRGGSGDRGGAGRRRRARPGFDALLRPGARSLPVHTAAHGRGVSAATVLPVRVMVEDVWNEVSVELPSSTPLGDLKAMALRQAGVPGDASRLPHEVPWRGIAGRGPQPGRRRRRAECGPRRAAAPETSTPLTGPRAGARRSRMTRAIVLFASAILAFDGVAVIVLGVLAHRPLFIVMGVVVAAAAVATLVSWSRHRARLEEIKREHDDLKDELRSLDNFIQRR